MKTDVRLVGHRDRTDKHQHSKTRVVSAFMLRMSYVEELQSTAINVLRAFEVVRMPYIPKFHLWQHLVMRTVGGQYETQCRMMATNGC